MPSFSRRAKALFPLLVIAALTVSVRLPFLLHGDRFFDSDEAVEGLMARHVLRGELPIFLWGQHYKGVPEVYVSAAVFSIAGSSVVALKATTLACFVLFVYLQFLLVEALFATRVAWMATALVIVGPPALVLWSLSANAEVVLTLLAGSVLGLALVRWQQSRSRAAFGVAAAAVGFGLWVHQYIVYYVIALGICVLWTAALVRTRLREIVTGQGLPRWIRGGTAVLLAIGATYFALGLMAFVTGGFDVTVGNTLIGLRSPQKLWRLGAALLLLYGGIRLALQLLQPDRRAGRSLALAGLTGFLVGYAPALAANLRSGGGLPIARMDVGGLTNASVSIASYIVPIVLGFRTPLTEWLPVSPWFGLVLAFALAASVAALRSPAVTPFFHMFLIVVPVVFLASGSFVDAQSYRYLMPVYGALPVALALGVDCIGSRSKPVAILTLSAILAIFAAQQMAWYWRLRPDTRSPAIIQCLTEHGVRGTRADYWLSYKLTFLSGEQVIIAPTNGVDRYPPYTALVRSLGESDADQACRSLLLQCTAPCEAARLFCHCRPRGVGRARARGAGVFSIRPHVVDQVASCRRRFAGADVAQRWANHLRCVGDRAVRAGRSAVSRARAGTCPRRGAGTTGRSVRRAHR